MAFAEAYLEAGDRARAAAIVHGLATGSARAGEWCCRARPAVSQSTTAEALFPSFSIVLAAELNRLRNERMPVALSQIARYAGAGEQRGFGDARAYARAAATALTMRSPRLRNVPTSRSHVLASARRRGSCARRCRPSGGSSSGRAACRIVRQCRQSAITRALGDVLANMKRHEEAAAAYARALQLRGSDCPARRPLAIASVAGERAGRGQPLATRPANC